MSKSIVFQILCPLEEEMATHSSILAWRTPQTEEPKQSILKEISPEYSLEGLMLKLKFLILWPPDVKN